VVVRHVLTPKFNPRRFSGEFRMRCDHLPIEQKRNVGVEFFLQFVQPLIGPVPGSRLVHREKDFVGLLVEGEKIDNASLLDSAARRFTERTAIRRIGHSKRFLDFTRNDKSESVGVGSAMVRTLWVICSALFLSAKIAAAQFTPVLLQNNSYWGDGKAEFNIYDAQIVREGIPRQCEALHILVREPFDPKQFVKPEGSPRPEAIAVLKLNQILHVPTGLYIHQQMHSNFWRVDNARLLKFSLTSNDSYGNTFKEARRNGDQLSYEYHTYWDGMAEGKENIAQPENGYFYDELPWLVRTIDFSKPTGQFDVQLAGSIINSKKDIIAFKPAKISFKSTEKTIGVVVEHAAGVDRFVLDRDGPYLLREWTAAGGGHMKLKRNLKVDYWNYNKPGDRERALANPMLRQPD
jgi:hypothetical protein